MPAFVTLDSLSAKTPDGRSLFANLTLAFGPERTGLGAVDIQGIRKLAGS